MRDDSQEDRALMAALVAGEQRALERIIERWERPLFSFVHRYTQNETATREIVQETFVRVFTKRLRYNPSYALSSWIFTIAANLCKNRSRWRHRHPEVSLEAGLGGDGEEGGLRMLDVLPADGELAGEAMQRDEELALLKAAVRGLPHDLRTAVLLHHYEELSYKEIAEIVGCSARGVETRLYRARKLLQERLARMAERSPSEPEKKTAGGEPRWASGLWGRAPS